MPEKLEKLIERWVCKKATELGVPSAKFTSPGDTGWPDRMFILFNGRCLFVEFKRVGGKLTAKQILKHAILRARGHDVQVHTSREEGLEAVKAALEASRISAQGCQVFT
jgi:hypothetical protein